MKKLHYSGSYPILAAVLCLPLVAKCLAVVVQEGEMRPQLLDRFGMCVNVVTMVDSKVRTQMVLDKLAYEMVHPHPLTPFLVLPHMGSPLPIPIPCMASISSDNRRK